MRKITPRITPDAAEFYGQKFNNVHAGAERALAFYPYLYRYTAEELKGKFTRSELSYLVDIHNAVAITAHPHHCRPEVLITAIEDADRFDGMGEKWQVNIKKLITRVRGLTSAQVYFLQELLVGFWYAGADREPDLEQFLKGYVND